MGLAAEGTRTHMAVAAEEGEDIHNHLALPDVEGEGHGAGDRSRIEAKRTCPAASQ